MITFGLIWLNLGPSINEQGVKVNRTYINHNQSSIDMEILPLETVDVRKYRDLGVQTDEDLEAQSAKFAANAAIQAQNLRKASKMIHISKITEVEDEDNEDFESEYMTAVTSQISWMKTTSSKTPRINFRHMETFDNPPDMATEKSLSFYSQMDFDVKKENYRRKKSRSMAEGVKGKPNTS